MNLLRRKSNANNKLADIRRANAFAKRFVVPKQYRFFFIVAMVTVIGGSILENTVGEQFIFSAANQYRAAVPWLLMILVPFFAWAWFVLERKTHHLAYRLPTWWVRWFIGYPLIVAISSTMVTISPLGWLAVYGRLCGKPTEGIKAKMIRVDKYLSNSRGCHQRANIYINDNSATICLNKVSSGRTPNAGEFVTVAGRISNVGLYIDQIRAK